MIIDDEIYQNLCDRRNSVIRWWKDKYNLCRTDERYLNATTEDIYEDYLDHISGKLNERWNNEIEEKIERSRLIQTLKGQRNE